MEHKTSLDVVYVTSYYPVEKNNTNEIFFQWFQPFIKTNLTIHIFSDCIDSLQSDLPSTITLHTIPRKEFRGFIQDLAELPEFRNKDKDVLEYIQSTLIKSECIYRVNQYLTSKHYVWVEWNLLTIIQNRERFFRELASISELTIQDKIVFPGCLETHQVQFGTLFTFPIWRFCGGFLIVPNSHVELLYTAMNEQIDNCKLLNKITWEVNLLAVIEQSHSDWFFFYKADHNDSILSFPKPQKPKKLIYLSMIKNESRIIQRSIIAALNIVDAVCICDTGSTDNTVDLLEEFYKTLSIPAKTYHHEWKHFGHNRSLSFLSAVDFCKSLGWDEENTYAILLDADMELAVQSGFSKDMLQSAGYKIIQRSGALEYYNTRFVKIGHPWKCVGVTHEYWDGANTDTLTPDIVYINDVGDGGCKSDKFTRDVRLLEEGLKEDPSNVRYMFYLAQSYKDSQQIDKSIEMYKKRIESGGWYEEVWYSMYTIMKLYAEKKQFADMEYWGLKAYEYRKERSENLLYLTKHFRDRRDYFKAWHYYCLGSVIPKPNDLLFIDTECYTKGFEYEKLILHDYIFPHMKQRSIQYTLDYYNKYPEYWAYSNLQWFVQQIPSKIRNLDFCKVGDYVATSTSFVKTDSSKYCVNVRYVNYRIQPDGSYLMMENGILSRDNAVRTRNFVGWTNSEFQFLGPLNEMEIKDPPPNSVHIKGLEDVRLFRKGEQTWYTATTMEYSYNGRIRQHMGLYDTVSHQFTHNQSLKPPTETECEKNWIPYKSDKIIYSWHPFKIGHLENSTLVIDSEQVTPNFLTNMRGSTTLVEENGFYWGLTHCVMYQQPRKYYHMMVKIDASTDKLVGFTQPFYFNSNHIEYCLAFEKKDDTCYTIISQNDCDPIFVEFSCKNLIWISV